MNVLHFIILGVFVKEKWLRVVRGLHINYLSSPKAVLSHVSLSILQTFSEPLMTKPRDLYFINK
jgi:hypothetical protein